MTTLTPHTSETIVTLLRSRVGRKRPRAGVLQRCLLSMIGLVPGPVAGAGQEGAHLELAESLLRPGYELVKGSSPLVRDINLDGRKDVFMAVETSCAERDGGTPCESGAGTRAIEVHYGQPDGRYRLAVRSGLIMTREEGGMDPDPFKGFTVTPKGSIQVHMSGGAGWVWEYTYTLQFRGDDIYVVGSSVYECNGARDDVECHKTDVNLLTRRWRRKSWVGDATKHKIAEGRTQSKELHRLRDAFPGMDPCASPPNPDLGSNEHVAGGPQSGFSCDKLSR